MKSNCKYGSEKEEKKARKRKVENEKTKENPRRIMSHGPSQTRT